VAISDESGVTELCYAKLGEEVKRTQSMNFLVPG
jgi:hypothetical protein